MHMTPESAGMEKPEQTATSPIHRAENRGLVYSLVLYTVQPTVPPRPVPCVTAK